MELNEKHPRYIENLKKRSKKYLLSLIKIKNDKDTPEHIRHFIEQQLKGI